MGNHGFADLLDLVTQLNLGTAIVGASGASKSTTCLLASEVQCPDGACFCAGGRSWPLEGQSTAGLASAVSLVEARGQVAGGAARG